MTTQPENNNAYGAPNGQSDAPGQFPAAPSQFGTPAQEPHPQVLKDQKDAKLYGILSIVFGALAFIIGILALPGLIIGIYGLIRSNRLTKAAIAPNYKALNIVGVVISSIATVLWILSLVLRFTGVV